MLPSYMMTCDSKLRLADFLSVQCEGDSLSHAFVYQTHSGGRCDCKVIGLLSAEVYPCDGSNLPQTRQLANDGSDNAFLSMHLIWLSTALHCVLEVTLRDCITSCTVTGVLKRRQYLSSAVSRMSLTGKRFIASFLKFPTSSSILQPAADLTLWRCAHVHPVVICFMHTVTYTIYCSQYGMHSVCWLKLSSRQSSSKQNPDWVALGQAFKYSPSTRSAPQSLGGPPACRLLPHPSRGLLLRLPRLSAAFRHPNSL